MKMKSDSEVVETSNQNNQV